MASTSDFTIIDEYLPKKPSFAGENYVPTVPGLDPFDRIMQEVDQYGKLQFPPGQTMEQAGIAQTAPKVNFNPQQPAAPPAQQPVTKVANPYLEEYLQRMSEYLKPPVYDKAREKRLQNAALINSLGNALTNVVNTMYASSGTPIIKTDNKYVLGSLNEAQRMREMQDQREDIYNRTKMGAFFQAGDMAMRDQYYDKQEKQMGKQGEQWQKQFDLQQAAALRDDEYKKWQMQATREERLAADKLRSDMLNEEIRHNKAVEGVELKKSENTGSPDEFNDWKKKADYQDAIPMYDEVNQQQVAMPLGIFNHVSQIEAKSIQEEYDKLYSGLSDPTDQISLANIARQAEKNIVLQNWRKHFDIIYDGKGGYEFRPRKDKNTGFNPYGGTIIGANQTTNPVVNSGYILPSTPADTNLFKKRP